MSNIHLRKLSLTALLLAISFAKTFSQDLSENSWNKSLEGKTIRNILINTYNVAESFNEESNYRDSSWIKGVANSFHYKTRDWVVKENLLFDKGDKVIFRDLNESERLLRKTNLFLEVKIYPVSVSNDEADIFVLTRDRWTLTYLAKYSPGDKSGYLGLKDINFIGLGHKADVAVTYNNDPSIGLGGRFRYTVPNIKGSFINAGLRLEANKKYSLKSFSVVRPFITFTKEWIGGVELKWERNTINLPDTNDNLVSRSLSKKSQDLWAGKVFKVDIDNKLFKRNTNLIISARVFTNNYTERPYSPFQYRILENNTIFLLGAGLVTRSFYKDKFVQEFGTTEDIPVGGLLGFMTGPEERELSNRWYVGIETSYTDWIDDFGYFSGRFGFGTFKNNNIWEQKTFNFDLLYHSYLYRWNVWTYRLFARYDLLLGSDRLSGERTYLYTGDGIRGLDKSIPDGTKRMVLNLESRIFSPYKFLGFILGGIAFTDFGLISDSDRSFFRSRFYQSYGAGLRIKNESIINAAFQLVLVFNPYLPHKNGAGLSVLLSSNFEIGIRDIGFSHPFIEPY